MAFESGQHRDEWIQAVRTAIAVHRTWEARRRRRRHSNASYSSLTEWGLSKLWQGVDFSANKRGTVVDRKMSMSSVSSMESLAAAWIPDEEVGLAEKTT